MTTTSPGHPVDSPEAHHAVGGRRRRRVFWVAFADRDAGAEALGYGSGFVSGSGKCSAANDVVVDALEPDGERLEQLVRQALEEQPSHEVDVPTGRAGDLVPALIGKRYLGRSTIGRRWTALHEPPVLETPDVVREPAPLPADQGGQRRDRHSPARSVPQTVQYVVIGQRKVAFRLQLAVHLVGQAQLYPDVGQPRSLLVRRQRSERGI